MGWERLTELYLTPPRAYHNLDHISDCLQQLDLHADGSTQQDVLEMALWWHDAVYDSRAKTNEERSAGAWMTFASGSPLDEAVRAEVARLIRITDHKAPAVDPAGQLIQDIDLSILGREEAVFDDYERKIRQEYSWVAEADYRAGRSNFLRVLLRRERLFLTELGWAKFESTARTNIARSLVNLDSAEPC